MRTFSQAGQDIFVRKVLGDIKGTFIDMGASHPVELSNTNALERDGWTGLLIERDVNAVKLLREQRTSTVVEADLTNPNHNRFWNLVPFVVDYLSVDLDENTLPALKLIPWNTHRFKVITCEHDAYRFGDGPRDEIRAILNNAGYIRAIEDVGMPNGEGGLWYFEDWWVNPKLVDNRQWEHLRAKGIDGTKFK